MSTYKRLKNTLFSAYDDFLSYSNESGEVGDFGWNVFLGAGSTIAVLKTTIENDHPGAYIITTAAGQSAGVNAGYARLRDILRVGFTLKVSRNSLASADWLGVGLNNDADTNLISFAIDPTVDNKVSLVLGNYVAQALPLAPVVTPDVYYVLEIEPDYNAGAVNFYVDGALVYRLSSNISWDEPMVPYITIASTAGGNAVTLDEFGLTLNDSQVGVHGADHAAKTPPTKLVNKGVSNPSTVRVDS